MRWRQVLDRAVAVLLIVPDHKLMDPATGSVDAVKGLAWVGRRVFEDSELTLGMRVVVTHRRTAARRDDAQSLQGGEHRCALHGTPVVGVQHQLATANPFCQARLVDQCAGMVSQFLRMNLPTDDLAAEDVLDHV